MQRADVDSKIGQAQPIVDKSLFFIAYKLLASCPSFLDPLWPSVHPIFPFNQRTASPQALSLAKMVLWADCSSCYLPVCVWGKVRPMNITRSLHLPSTGTADIAGQKPKEFVLWLGKCQPRCLKDLEEWGSVQLDGRPHCLKAIP